MKTKENRKMEHDKVVEANQNAHSKRVSEFPSMFGSSRTVPSPDWAQYAASLATTAARPRRASRGIL